MNKEQLEYYKEYSEAFIKETLGYDLFPWQIEVLKMYIENRDKFFIARFGRTPAKKMFYEAIDKIEKELF